MMYKLAEKEKEVMEKMKRGEELEKMFLQAPTHLNLSHQASGFPFSEVSVPSTEFSSPSSSCFSNNGFCLSDHSSPFSPIEVPFYFNNSTQSRTATDSVNGLWLGSNKEIDSLLHFKKNVSERSDDGDDEQLVLCENLCRMHIREEKRKREASIIKTKRLEMDPHGICFGFGEGSLDESPPYNIKSYGTNVSSEGYNKSACGFAYGGSASSSSASMHFDSEMNSALHGLCGGYDNGVFTSANLGHNQFNDLGSIPSYSNTQYSNLVQQRNDNGRSWTNGEIQLQNPYRVRPYVNDAFLGSRPYGFGSERNFGVMRNQSCSPPLDYSNLDFCLNNLPNGRVSQSHVPINGAGSLDSFDLEDSFIIQGNNVSYVTNKGCNLSMDDYHKNNLSGFPLLDKRSCDYNGGSSRNDHGLSTRSQASLPILAEVCDYIHLMARDQNGCRFLQRVFDEGTGLEVQIIFNNIIDQIVELMMEQFGNYLVQKLLDVCNEEQRTHVLLMATREPGQLVRISLNQYGTRVVQKMIETLRTRQQISLVTAALRPGFLDLVKDLNGNHVLQRCLQCFSSEDNEFILDTAVKFCVEIATHRHGCCVLQRCIAYSCGRYRDKLINEVSLHGLLLAQDAFGNYVVQYIVELKIPSATANLLAQFKGHYVQLSMQKCSSHVVEKCLKHFGESRPQIVYELLSVPNFEQLLQDPFANYVIQTALSVTKGVLHASLVEAVRPHSILRTSPYCKRIFSRNISKK